MVDAPVVVAVTKRPVVRVDGPKAAPTDEALALVHATLIANPQSLVLSSVATLLPTPSPSLMRATMIKAAGLGLQVGAAIN